MMNQRVRVRYAPSPTGFLHIGGARSALYNYLFAKHNGGDFIVRIEDTDIERNVEGGIESQLDGLAWLGIVPDESPFKPNPKYAPYKQTERLETYRHYADQLLANGHAYLCYCTEDELEKDREAQLARGIVAPQYNRRCYHASDVQKAQWAAEGRTPCIRLKLKDHHVIKFNDMVRGPVSFNNDDIGDWVIVKSNGIPTYNYAVVIDDHTMDITHVMRGEEHLSNTPKQIQLYEYFGWDIPTFGHMTLITNEEGKKLSKRDPKIIQFIQQYRNFGYLPEAIFNFILLLGWSPSEEREIYSREEAIAIFDEKRLSKSPSMFDRNKLIWINNQYVKALSAEAFYDLVYPFISKSYNLSQKTDQWVRQVVELFHPQISFGEEIIPLVSVFFEKAPFDEEATAIMNEPTASQVVQVFAQQIESIVELTPDAIKVALKATQTISGQKGKFLYMPLRVALTGHVHGPDFTSVVMLLGRDVVLTRLRG